MQSKHKKRNETHKEEQKQTPEEKALGVEEQCFKPNRKLNVTKEKNE